jgi:hypothetical protein
VLVTDTRLRHQRSLVLSHPSFGPLPRERTSSSRRAPASITERAAVRGSLRAVAASLMGKRLQASRRKAAACCACLAEAHAAS